MSTPPLLPPPWPLPPASTEKKGLPGCVLALLIGLAFVVLMSVLAALAVPAYNRVRDKARELEAQKQAAKRLPPLTVEQKTEALKFGGELEKALNGKEKAALEAMTDFEELASRSVSGLPQEAQIKAGFIKGVKGRGAGLFTSMMGGELKLLRLIERDGYPALTYRMSPAAGGLNFVDVLIRPGKEGFKAVDLFAYLFGGMASADARQALVLMQTRDRGSVGRLLGFKSASASDLETIGQMFSKVPKGDFKGIVRDYETLPPDLRDTRTSFVLYVTALQHVQEDKTMKDRYMKALESAPVILGPDSAPDLLMLDMHLGRKDYKACERGLDNVMKVVGEDAGLLHLKGMVAAMDGDSATSGMCLAAAEKLEPRFPGLIDLRIQTLALKHDYAGVVAEVRRFGKEPDGFTITPDMLREPVWEGFKKSPEFASWAKTVK